MICRKDSGKYRICEACRMASCKPCPECGKSTPQITVMGKPRINPTCTACTSHLKADTRRVGKRCKICKQRRHDVDQKYQVCPDCLAIKVPCPVCGQPMSRFKKRGLLRKVCSFRCSKISHPSTHEQLKRAQITKWKDHVYKSHQNDIARGKSEYTEWRNHVFERDNYTCQKCGEHSGNGHAVELHPHHIKPFATNPLLRYDLDNGITLCKSCHRKEHNHVFIGRAPFRTSDKR